MTSFARPLTPEQLIEEASRNEPTLQRISRPTLTRQLRTAEARDLAEALRANTSVAELSCQAFAPGSLERSLTDLADALRHNAALRELRLHRRHVGDRGAAAIADALQENVALRRLFLEDCDVGADGAAALAGALRQNTGLEFLVLVRCRIGDEGAAAIAGALEGNGALRVLSLTDCGIGGRGARALADALKFNSTLKALRVDRNDIGDDGAQAIADALNRHNHSIREVYLVNRSYGVAADDFAQINEKYGLVWACAKKTGMLPKSHLPEVIGDSVLPFALERMGEMESQSLSIIFDFLRERPNGMFRRS